MSTSARSGVDTFSVLEGAWGGVGPDLDLNQVYKVEPIRMRQIETIRFLHSSDMSRLIRDGTYALRTSPKRLTPRMVWRTERTAEENMWVTGEVTLIDNSPATQMRKPTMPCASVFSIWPAAIEMQDAQ